jgi:hypothetical protein
MCFCFGKQIQLLNLQISLQFEMPPLPMLQKTLLDVLDNENKIKYQDTFSLAGQTQCVEGKIEIVGD